MCTVTLSDPRMTILDYMSRSDFAVNRNFEPTLWKTVLVAGLWEFGVEDKGVWTRLQFLLLCTEAWVWEC